jgi:predicted homoserine dehydrogenase-like protein
LGLAHEVKVVRAVRQGQSLTWDDVQMPASRALELRREMER